MSEPISSGDFSMIAEVLHLYPDACQRLDRSAVERHSGFSGAGVFRLQTFCGEFALRRWAAKTLPVARVVGLHRLLSFLFHRGVSTVAVPVASLQGETLVRHGNHHWQLEPWMPGRADFHIRPSREKLHAAMTALSAWHYAAAEFVPRDSEHIWFGSSIASASPAVGERLKKIAKWTEGGLERLRSKMRASPDDEFRCLAERILPLFARTVNCVSAELRTLGGRLFRLQPCLRDVWHDHVLYSGERVTGLVDASACRCENVVTDLSRLLGSFVADDREAWSFAVSVYEQNRPLSPEEWRLMRAIDHSTVLLSGLYWLDRRYLRQQKFAAEERLFRRLQTIVDRGEHLAESMLYTSHG